MMWLHVLLIIKVLVVTAVTRDSGYISYDDLAKSSRFSDEGVTTYAQLLFNDASQEVIVGARDNLYRLEWQSLTPVEHTKWPAPLEKFSLCQAKGKTAEDCHNYVKILVSNGTSLFVCGTNAFNPECTWRNINNINSVTSTISGVTRCPYSPQANVTALLSSNFGLFVGASTDFSGIDTAIYRTMLSPPLRSQPYDPRWLNDPQFLGSFATEKHVYFLFREMATEYMNCGKKVYSRIARVCKNDLGSRNIMKGTWLTFSKARLNCSIPGDFPFYYDEMQGAVYSPEEKILYATFTTPSNAIAGSAICAFNMTAIESSFNGAFKYQEHPRAAWERQEGPNHHRQHCESPINMSPRQVQDNNQYQLMDDAVQGVTLPPLYTVAMERFTHIAVDVVPTTFQQSITILYVATSEGLIKKFFVLPETHETCVVEVWGPLPSPVITLQFLKDTRSLYVGMETGLLRTPASQCQRYKGRKDCNNDPYCIWSAPLMTCEEFAFADNVMDKVQREQTYCPLLINREDDGWGAWSNWSLCPVSSDALRATCQCRNRQCNNPSPQKGDFICRGPRIEVSNCTVEGSGPGLPTSNDEV